MKLGRCVIYTLKNLCSYAFIDSKLYGTWQDYFCVVMPFGVGIVMAYLSDFNFGI